MFRKECVIAFAEDHYTADEVAAIRARAEVACAAVEGGDGHSFSGGDLEEVMGSEQRARDYQDARELNCFRYGEGPRRWTKPDFDKLADFEPANFSVWLQLGLRRWADSGHSYLAFHPVENRFAVNGQIGPLEHQLHEMALSMPRAMREKFRGGVEIAFAETSRGSPSAIFDGVVAIRDLLQLSQR